MIRDMNKIRQLEFFSNKLGEQINELEEIMNSCNDIDNRFIEVMKRTKRALNTSCVIRDILIETDAGVECVDAFKSTVQCLLSNAMVSVISSYDFSKEDEKFIYADL